MLLKINQFIWGLPGIVAILGVGIYLSVRTKFAQLRLLSDGFQVFVKQAFLKRSDSPGVTPYQAFCTALGATVGTGNIVGVGGAIALGGPGAVFWMWICALFGMVIKYAEALLAVYYQKLDTRGQVVAGPMHIITSGMGKSWRPLACIYAFLGVVASFGVGNSVQINAVLGGIKRVAGTFGGNVPILWSFFLGASAAIMIYIIFSGGAKRITSIAEQLVPFVSGAYILLCVTVLIARWQNIGTAIWMIVQGAFAPQAVTGGVVGSIFLTMRIGTSRGVFTNEAGLGTAGIAHGSTKTEHPAKQGVLGIMEVFLDTIVICTLTALVILCSGAPIEYGYDFGGELTNAAFAEVFGSWISIPLAFILICLAIATVLGWGLYGLRCAQFLFGDKTSKVFIFFQAIAALLGAAMQTPAVWLWAELVNGLMMIPNLIMLVHQTSLITKLSREYEGQIKSKRKFHHRINTVPG